MPLYDYKCTSCDHTFRKMERMANREQPTNDRCPNCDEKTVVNVIGSPALAYHQPGIHRTTDNFNDRLKQIKENVAVGGKESLSNVIR